MWPLLLVSGITVAVLAALWAVRSYRDLVFLRSRVKDAWTQLQDELTARREIIPYLVASVHVKASQAVEVIGNACDLAAHVLGVQESAQAEARLTAAMNRFFELVDSDSDLSDNESVLELRRRLGGVEMRIGVLRDSYNMQAQALNARLESGLGRALGQLPAFKKAELF